MVTVHARPPQQPAAFELKRWAQVAGRIDQVAASVHTRVALEVVEGFELVAAWGLVHVGINLDVGHMHLPANAARLSAVGGIGALVRQLGDSLVHMHWHDVRGTVDHLETGTGVVDLAELVHALRDIQYAHDVTLELNPDRFSPEGIVRSKAYVEQQLRVGGL